MIIKIVSELLNGRPYQSTMNEPLLIHFILEFNALLCFILQHKTKPLSSKC